MTGRERLLAKVVGASVGVLALYQTTQWLIVTPFRTVSRDLERARATRQSLELMSQREGRAAGDWRERVEQTLAGDPVQAANLFRRDIEILLKAHHLEREGVVQSNAPRTSKNGMVEVPLAVTAKGRLADVVAFLRDFYRRPYLAQITRLMLNAGDSKPKDGPAGKGTHRDKGSAEQISVEMSVVTLVLPPKADVKGASPVGSLEALAERANDARLARGDPSEYDRIVAQNMFGWPAPPVIARADPPPATQAVRTEPPKMENRRPEPPPRPREKVVVCGVASTHGQYEAYVRHEGKNTEPPKTYRLNDEFDGGRIVLIHPLGIVVRRGDGEGATQRDTFYPLGMSSEEREREKPPVPVEVAEDLRIALGTGE